MPWLNGIGQIENSQHNQQHRTDGTALSYHGHPVDAAERRSVPQRPDSLIRKRLEKPSRGTGIGEIVGFELLECRACLSQVFLATLSKSW